ncbi:MAG: helix-turn-helix domain-containing protein [Clostridia bacterium]|nr:helix-turn-helix domain-containing protein [Clostridia bacterium]
MGELLETKTSIFGVNFLYSERNEITEREIHNYHEFLFYIDGNATFRTENFRKKLKQSTLIFIPKGKFHLFTLENPKKFFSLKFSFSEGEITKNLPTEFLLDAKLISNLDPLILSLLEDCVTLLKKEVDDTDRLRLYGNFISLISTFSKIDCAVYRKNYSPAVLECIEYVEKNLSEDLTISNLSKVLGFSTSTLSHTFKTQTGISLHGYVCQKRLSLAKMLLDKGEKPTEIYTKCGYKDYSSFYKAYVKEFSTKPRQQKH